VATSIPALQSKLENCGRLSVEITALGGGDENQAGLRSSGLDRSGKGGFQFGGHAGDILNSSIVTNPF